MKHLIAICATTLLSTPLFATEGEKKDKIKTVELSEVQITSMPKETQSLLKTPSSVSQLNSATIESYNVASMKDVSTLIPNFFIPDYGSKLTSALYIRGVGSRLNTPAVALYVDNVPYLDKSSFDFDFYDVERIDVLRGPQGTLYGRNTLGGVVHVHTRSPLKSEMTRVSIGGGSYGELRATLARHHQFRDDLAFSISGYVDRNDGYFKNSFTGKRVDPSLSTGGRARLIFRPSANLKMELGGQFDFVDQGGYAYGAYNDSTGKVSSVNYNDEAGYMRRLSNINYSLVYDFGRYRLTSTSSFQALSDHMKMDQDYTPRSIFTLDQIQKQNSISQEIVIRSENQRNYQFVTGFSGFYQSNKNNSPVVFKEDGIQDLFQSGLDYIPSFVGKATVMDESMRVDGDFSMPTISAALFHQMDFHNIFGVNGLSATLGLRGEYESIKMKYNTGADLNVNWKQNMPNLPARNIKGEVIFKGDESVDYWQLLPKFAIKYDFNRYNMIYANVARGYKSGGFNFQGFSDLIQSFLTEDIMNKMYGKPAVDTEIVNIRDYTKYDPEYNWSYEIGYKGELIKDRWFAEAAIFSIESRNQQITQFAPAGFGRMAKNAGRSHSAGVELSTRAEIFNNLWINASYGYTNARFTQYKDSVKIDGEIQEVDYKGKKVPMVPSHTLSIGLNYSKALKNKVIDRISCSTHLNGAGEIYWTESNTRKQPFYMTLDAKLSLHHKRMRVDLWSKNITNTQYQAFYFESMGSPFAQLGKPVTFGADLVVRF
ncbi:MAG: TonB-dependent receptor [Bacteroidales bacterium]